MKLILFSLISILFVLVVADSKTCAGTRCKRMTNIVAKLYNDYDYGYSQGNSGGSNYNQNGQGYGGSNQNGQGYGGSNQNGQGYGGSNQNGQGYGGSNQNGQGYGGSNQNGQGYGGSNQNGQGYNQNSDSDCPNCYARDFGNGEYNKNIINVEKK